MPALGRLRASGLITETSETDAERYLRSGHQQIFWQLTGAGHQFLGKFQLLASFDQVKDFEQVLRLAWVVRELAPKQLGGIVGRMIESRMELSEQLDLAQKSSPLAFGRFADLRAYCLSARYAAEARSLQHALPRLLQRSGERGISE